MSCPHIKEFKSRVGLESYETIHSSFILPSNQENPTYYKAWLSCFDCEVHNSDCRLLACLHCIYFGCYEKHIEAHAISKSHILCVELSNGQVICLACQDIVYDPDIDEIVQENHKKCLDPCYVPWKPSEEECQLLEEHSKRIKVEANSSIGMRGMKNLGNSCFMNCIIQALLHTPMLRDYFFTDKHVCYAKKSSDCLFCHFSSLFQRYYTDDDPTTLSLHEILYLFWQNDPNLSQYEQKDAHEFFISARNLLHQFSSPPNSGPQVACNCIIDTIFHGKLQSDLVCQTCSNVSTKIDPLWEISLDIPEPPAAATLLDCLHHYTHPEPLGSSAKIECSTCKTYQESTKQLTFKLLPLVIVIHLKRFEHVKSKHKKKCLYVSFPLDLDMSPFLTGERNKNDVTPSIPSEFTNGDNRYSLYAVIVHSGTMGGGHYLAYIRRTMNSWFKCNDMLVVPADVEEVLSSEAYLLFYHKIILPYE